MIFETARLSLRAFGPADSTPLLDVFGDAEVMRYSDGVQSLAWVESWLLGEQKSYRERGYGKWTVISKTGDLPDYCIGYCGLSYVGDLGGHPEVALGYRLARRYWGRGYASEAAHATIDYGFNVLGLKRIVATIDPGNAASLRVAVKAGMVYERDVLLAGYTYPDRVYALQKV